MTASRAASLALLVLLAGCAKEEPPPGTRPDRAAPRPVELRPEYGAVLPGYDGSVSVRFDEPLANPRNLGRDIVGSPAGRYEVKAGRRGIDVRPEGGWRDGVVYYLKMPAGVADLLRNQTTTPVEWLFSTGEEIVDTEVSGRVIDRVTMRGSRGTRVLFLAADSIPYTAVTDTGGIFRLPGLPYGSYEAAGFQDQNRDFSYDARLEPGGFMPFELSAAEPKATLEILQLPADSTPPVLVEVTAVDTLTLRLRFDEPLDDEADLSGVAVTVRDSASGAEFEVVEIAAGDLPRLEVPEPGVDADSAAAALDSVAAADSAAAAAADTAAAAADTAATPPAPAPRPAPGHLSVRLAAPLAAGTYAIEISGVPNLRSLLGGGSRTFVYEPPPPRPVADPEAAEGDEGDGEDPAAPAAAPEDAPAPPERDPRVPEFDR